MLNTVLFDMGGTLEDIWNTQETQAKAMDALQKTLRAHGLEPGCSPEEFDRRVMAGLKEYKRWSEGLELEKKPEEIWPDYYLKEFGFDREKLIPITEELANLWEVTYYHRELRGDVLETLEALHTGIVAADGAACCGKGRHKVGVLPHQPKKLSAVLLRHIRHGELHRYHDHQHGGTDQQLQHAARAAVRGLLPLSLCFAARRSGPGRWRQLSAADSFSCCHMAHLHSASLYAPQDTQYARNGCFGKGKAKSRCYASPNSYKKGRPKAAPDKKTS